jgi:hypothetical protein
MAIAALVCGLLVGGRNPGITPSKLQNRINTNKLPIRGRYFSADGPIISLKILSVACIMTSKKFWKVIFSLGTRGFEDFFMECNMLWQIKKRIRTTKIVVTTSCPSGDSEMGGIKENQVNPCSISVPVGKIIRGSFLLNE